MTISKRTKGTGSRTCGLLVAALLGFALASLAPRPARAQPSGSSAAYIIGLGAVLVVVDGVFLVHDGVVAAQGDHPSTAFSWAEVVVMAPQAAIFGALTASNMTDRDPSSWSVYPSLLTGAMLTHGIWALSSAPDKPLPETRFMASGAVGVNATLSVSVLAALLSERRLFDTTMGITEVVLTLPQVAVGAAGIGLYPEDRLGWAGFTAWSGALLAHGVASIALGGSDAPEESSSRGRSPGRRAGPLEPRILGFGPAPIGGLGGHGAGLGFTLRGSM